MTTECDGYVVVSSRMDPRRVVPPYRIVYEYDHYTSLNDAADSYTMIEAGEYHGLSAVGIFPSHHGMPVDKPMIASDLARLVRETRAA